MGELHGRGPGSSVPCSWACAFCVTVTLRSGFLRRNDFNLLVLFFRASSVKTREFNPQLRLTRHTFKGNAHDTLEAEKRIQGHILSRTSQNTALRARMWLSYKQESTWPWEPALEYTLSLKQQQQKLILIITHGGTVVSLSDLWELLLLFFVPLGALRCHTWACSLAYYFRQKIEVILHELSTFSRLPQLLSGSPPTLPSCVSRGSVFSRTRRRIFITFPKSTPNSLQFF